MTRERQEVFNGCLERLQRRLFYTTVYNEAQINDAVNELIELNGAKRAIKLMAAMLIEQSDIQRIGGQEEIRKAKIQKIIDRL